MAKNSLIQFSSSRLGELVGIMLWSAHWHSGQASQEYRMGCRARQLLSRSSEIGDYLASQWFDDLEGVVGEKEGYVRGYSYNFVKSASVKYQDLSRISEGE